MYVLHRWNKKYGNGAKFIVENEDNGKFTEFSPARPKDVAWVDTNLAKESEYKGWEDFQKEKVQSLDMVIM